MFDWLLEHYIEIFGAATGILFVFLEIRQNIWLWPLGIVTSGVYIWVFVTSGLYADMGLQGYYLIISIYGWYWWKRGNRNDQSGTLSVSSINLKMAGLLFSAMGILFLLIWFILYRFTDSTIPGWDAFTTAVSIVATWMLARKFIEHWILWIIADVVSIGLYIYKGLYPTVVLFTIYAVMAFIGYKRWMVEMRQIN